jgi:hypothetical protein
MSDQTVGNILKRHGIPPAPERTKTLPWREFIRIHLAVLRATDFFTTEAWRRLWLVLSSCLMFFLCLHCHAICSTAIAALRHTRGMLSRLRWCRPWHAAAERWGVLVRERGWSRLPLGGTGLCRPSLSPCATHDRFDRPPQGWRRWCSCPLPIAGRYGMGLCDLTTGAVDSWATRTVRRHERVALRYCARRKERS